MKRIGILIFPVLLACSAQPESASIALKEDNQVSESTSVEETVSPKPMETADQPSTEAPEVKQPTTDKEASVEKTAPQVTKPDHTPFNSLLSKYVSSSGKVNYTGLKSHISTLDAYLADLSAHAPQTDWTKNEKLAYWINVYNAFTLKLIVDNLPVSSITQLHGGKPWDKKWIQIGDKTYSLNDVENTIIRPQFKDPRIHFAVNCAAKSCPPLANKAFTAENLQSLLESRTKSFINSSSNDISLQSVKVSKIFDWYAVDFGDLITFLNKYSSTEISGEAKISYQEYNWDLND